MKQLRSLKSQYGYLTLVTVVLIIIVGFIAVALAYISYSSSFATINLQKSTSALYLAESGLEDATHELATATVANRSACSGLSLSNSIGDGTYTVTSTGPFYASSPTTLSGALTVAATSVPVASTASYQNAGQIMIDQELINYTSVDTTHFLYVQRGQGGTTSAVHAAGTAVGQYQCYLTSTGGAPNITPSSGAPGGKRILNEVVGLQEAWAVGNADGSNLTFIRWNRPTELAWNSALTSGSFNLNAVSMNSYADGWAVGASTNFMHWNGSSWNTVASGLSNVTYNDVFCSSKNNCHVVGNMVGGSAASPTIADWNGTKWTAASVSVLLRAGNQWAVNCATASDCWSVGDVGITNILSYFYHWNGTGWSSSSLSSFANGDFPFRGVACPTTTNCWAVGSSANFAEWNGSSWSRVASGMPSVQYNGVYCNSTTDCWAVGNVSGNDVIVHWNGTKWSRDASNPTPAVNLNQVACTNQNDCWAVGAASGGEPTFLHWNGTAWVKFTTSGLPNVPANAISIVGNATQPWCTWSENFS